MSKATFDPRLFNQSGNTPFSTVLEHSMARRKVLRGGIGLASATLLGGMLSACGSSDDGGTAVASDTVVANQPNAGGSITLGFDSIPGSLTDACVVPPGYTAQVLAPWGTPLTADGCAWKSDGTNTSAELAHAVGMHHDGIYFFPIDGNPEDGMLLINHEYIDQGALHPNGPTRDADTGKRTDIDEIRKEIISHGVAAVRVQRDGAGQWQVVENDPLNRRYTGGTPMKISGAVSRCTELITKYSPDGSTVRGTLNNCGNGYTPWGTYLTCEENWPGYFVNTGDQDVTQRRIGIADEGTRYGWEDLAGHTDEIDDEFSRFDTTPGDNSAAYDYRNEANGHGYIVEIDPYTNSQAVKRTSLGRFRHEGCVPATPVEGQPVVFYSGHDGRGEYIYKFVSAINWDPADANPADRLATGAKYMDNGTLYVARFNEDGTGDWEALTTANPKLSSAYSDQATLILDTVRAADAVGATPMDRPEWGAIDPVTGSVYFTLTNNTRRGTEGSVGESGPNARNDPDAANPRAENANGHIIRWDESADHQSFTWDIFVFGSYAGAPEDINRSGLQELNQFASPDGLAFDDRGILWIQTDNGADEVESYTNDQMLAVVPSQLDGPISAENQVELRRFFVGPNGCEVTGVAFTPDRKHCFLNIQHPGNWPYSTNAAEETPDGLSLRPRASTVVISRADGGEIGV